MSGFDPGPGWVEVDGTWDQTSEALRWDNGTRTRYWIRETPVPPLPTEPYTVIRVTKSGDPDLIGQVLTSNGVGYWSNSGHTLGPASTERRILAFEVLAEPRAGAVQRAEESARRLTAKAVLERVRASETAKWSELDKIAREFGVES